ncbi:hypothetical protein [Deefgea rivuli]|uniref:hypothetical protein n=1 Tax=Deefgea rivuli TaxID=400948 RepID=UPI000483190B|nr:hypothetical protein [Deefgea rivuli]
MANPARTIRTNGKATAFRLTAEEWSTLEQQANENDLTWQRWMRLVLFVNQEMKPIDALRKVAGGELPSQRVIEAMKAAGITEPTPSTGLSIEFFPQTQPMPHISVVGRVGNRPFTAKLNLSEAHQLAQDVNGALAALEGAK